MEMVITLKFLLGSIFLALSESESNREKGMANIGNWDENGLLQLYNKAD